VIEAVAQAIERTRNEAAPVDPAFYGGPTAW
jgi:hypothetical protein